MKLDDLILNSKGRWVSVTFKKKDGTVRVLNCRLGVTKHLKGGSRTSNPDDYIVVWSTDGYRHINRNTIMSVRCGGQEYAL